MGRVYALANQKGGVGKTTTTVNLGAYLADAGKRVLLVDVDPQGNATSSLGIDKNALSRSMYDVLIASEPAANVVMLTARMGMDLLPSSPHLAGAEVEMVEMTGRELRLRRALQASLGMLTVNALTASDGVLIPVQCEYLPLEGLSQLLQTIDLVRQNLNPDLTVRGLIMTMYDSRTNLARQVVDEVREHFPSTMFRSIIPRSIKLSEAPSYGEPIISYSPESSGGRAYAALCQELLQEG